ncbi:hypothetical protein LDENG_00123360, partial [Lucifuga dentata]
MKDRVQEDIFDPDNEPLLNVLIEEISVEDLGITVTSVEQLYEEVQRVERTWEESSEIE